MVLHSVLTLAALCFLLLIPGCQREEEEKPEIEISPRAACLNECKQESEKIYKECQDEFKAQALFDRLPECSTRADKYSQSCREECYERHPVGQAG